MPAPPPEGSFISPDQAELALKANWRNLLRKVQAGKTLSPGEVAMLKAAQAGGQAPPQAFAKNQVELADLLGVSRKTIQRALKVDGHPVTRPDGRYDVNAWRDFLQGAGDDTAAPSITEQRARNLLLQNERLELQIAILRKEYVAATEVERWGSELGAAIRKVVCQIHLAAPSVVGGSVPDAESRLKEVEDEILQQLHVLSGRIGTLKHDEPSG